PRPGDGSLYVLAGASVYRSTDGGAHFAHLGDFGALHGGDFADDGTVYLATDQGIQRAVDGAAFLASGTRVLGCVSWHGGALYGCTSQSIDGYALARSIDQGQNWTPILNLGQNIVGPLACVEDSVVCVQCYAAWPAFATQMGLQNQSQPMC